MNTEENTALSGKKALMLCILQILREYSDAEHPMEQKPIIELLSKDYHLTADRKTVRNNVRQLVELGYPIEHCREGLYYEHEFSDSELRMLMDNLPDTLKASQREQIVRKLSSLGSRYFATWKAERKTPEDGELLYTLDVLQEAIRKRCRVRFHYGHYDIDKKLHLKMSGDGSLRDYAVSPYRTVVAAGHYLLLGNTDPYDGVTHYRIDRIRDIRLMEQEPARPQHDTGVSIADMASYLSQRPYMYSDAAEPIRLRISRKITGDVLDWFGMDVRFQHAAADTVEAEVTASPTAMKYWALQYGEVCEVLAPEALRQEMKQITGAMAAAYAADGAEAKKGE